MHIEILPKDNRRKISVESTAKTQPLYGNNEDKRVSTTIMANSQKKKPNKSYKCIGSNSEIVILYRKPTNGNLRRD